MRKSKYACTNPSHNGFHSGLKSLHPIECYGISLGLLEEATLEDSRYAVEVLSGYFKIPSVPVVFGPNYASFWGRYFWDDRIEVYGDPKGRNMLTLVHEFAHHLSHRRYLRTRHTPHGKLFQACYTEAIDVFKELRGLKLL